MKMYRTEKNASPKNLVKIKLFLFRSRFPVPTFFSPPGFKFGENFSAAVFLKGCEIFD